MIDKRIKIRRKAMALAICMVVLVVSASAATPSVTILEEGKRTETTVIPYQATDYKFKVFSLGEVPENFGATDFNDSDFLIGDAAFGSGGECPLQSTVKTSWPTRSEIVLRKSFELPAGASNLSVFVAIDNDVQVLINGIDISGGLVIHEKCPVLDEFLFEAPDAILREGENLLAVRARDRGVESYVDLRVLVDMLLPSISISTNETSYTTGEPMNIEIGIANPTEDSLTFQWYWLVPQFSVCLPVMSSSIPAGYDETLEYSFAIPDWGATGFGNVFYVQLAEEAGAGGEVLDVGTAGWIYSPSREAGTEATSVEEANIANEIKRTVANIANEIKRTVERIG